MLLCGSVHSHIPYITEILTDHPQDDSALNCKHAQQRGWETAHLVEKGEPQPAAKASKYQISHLSELRGLFPQLFKAET